MLKQALDENNHIICLGDLNKNDMINLPTTVNDIVALTGLVNIKDNPIHFDKHTGNISLLDPILITDSIQVIDSDRIAIDIQISDHDGTYVTFKCGFSN
jgi:hypothetical protein